MITDKEINQVADDEKQKDWNELRYADIYKDAFVDGAKWARSKVSRVELPVIATNQNIKNSIKEILWMARRYADGRQTFAATSFNDAYDLLRDEFGEDIEYNKISEWKDQTLTENGKYFPYAQDGGGQMFDCVSGRKYYNNDKD